MGTAKVWKLGKKWAGISARGKRVVKDTKDAARTAVGLSKSSSKKSKTSRKNTTKNKGGNRMGKGKSTTRTLFKLLRIGSLAGSAIYHAARSDLTAKNKFIGAFRTYTAYDMSSGKFDAGSLLQGYGPYAVTCAVTYGIPKLVGMIRRL